jgi:invasion protein IalB
MPKHLRLLALSLGLAAATGLAAVAQTTTTPPAEGATPDATIPIPTTPEPATEPPAIPADALAIGTEAVAPGLPSQADAPVNGLYLAASFDAWEQRCVKTEDGSDPCQLYQLLKGPEGNPVAEISMFDLPQGGDAVVGATVIVPLETLLTANLRIGIDSASPKIYPFTYCTNEGMEGCVARIGFTAAELAALKKGILAKVTIVPAVAPDQTVILDMSLRGFTKGYEAIKALTPPPPKP